MDRLIVFVDYQNVHGWARRRFRPHSGPAAGHVNPVALGELLAKKRNRATQLKQVRVYRGRPNPERQQGAARANDRQAADWARSDRVEVVRRNLQYPRDWPQAKAIEKGIDVAIAVDMIRLAMNGEMDAAILFSSDKDLLPALEVLWDLPNVTAEVACWSGAPRIRIDGTQRPWCHNLSEPDFLGIEDRFDYAAPA